MATLLEYSEKLVKFNDSRSAYESMLKRIAEAQAKLLNRDRVWIAGGNFVYPISLPLNPIESIDSQQWPSINDIHKVILDYRTAKMDLKQAYAGLSASDRTAVSLPSDV